VRGLLGGLCGLRFADIRLDRPVNDRVGDAGQGLNVEQAIECALPESDS
jgi:hypothetical protein